MKPSARWILWVTILAVASPLRVEGGPLTTPPEYTVAPDMVDYLAFADEQVTLVFISKRKAVTAAHVCDGQTPGSCSVSVGGQTATCRVHPKYVTPQHQRDIAVCDFTADVSKAFLNPKPPGSAKVFTVAGFGCWEEGSTVPDPDNISAAPLKLVGPGAGGYSVLEPYDNTSRVCWGDSGGPVLLGHVTFSALPKAGSFSGVISGFSGDTSYVNLFDSCTLKWIKNKSHKC